MERFRFAVGLWAALLALVVGAACGGGVAPETALPEVVGKSLDVAKTDLEAAGFGVEVEGGGLFGVVEEASWEVCRQDPTGGTPQSAGAEITLFVQRTCEEEPDEDSGPAPNYDLEGVDLRILGDRLDLTNRSEDEWRDCRVTINPRGVIRRLGYDRILPSERFGPGDYIGLPYGSFTNRDGERFNFKERAVEAVLVECVVDGSRRSGRFGPPR